MYEKLTYFYAKKILSGNTLVSTLPNINISILRNVTVDQIDVFLKYFCAEFSIKANCHFGNFDTILQDIISPEFNLINDSTDVTLIFYNLDFAYPNLKNDFSTLTSNELDIITNDILSYVETCIENIRKKSNSLILWPSFESFLFTALGIKDNVFDNGINDFILKVNIALSTLFNRTNNCYFIHSDHICARVGEANFYDPVRSISAAAPYSINGLKAFALECSKYVRALTGKVKKCIVLDCDNTLWKGIVGESKISSLEIGQKGYPSEAFYAFQRFVKQLSNKGIVIALCSKNNEEDVWAVFDSHKGMLLKKSDITSARINWADKASNIKDIAQELNLGLDSFVFIDDSDFECDLVREALHEVDVIQMGRNPLETIQEIIERGLFDQFTITGEDQKRALMYADDIKRKASQDKVIDLQTYLKNLKIRVEIVIDDIGNVPRISQLTQKTNQFNCTTKRYSETQVEEFIHANDSHVFSLQVEDKFGNLGIVGVIIVNTLNTTEVNIDTFLLSCRALGREIEIAFLNEVCLHFKGKGISNITSTYAPTLKNKQVSHFFLDNQFKTVSESSEFTHFSLKLDDFKDKKNIFEKVEIINGC